MRKGNKGIAKHNEEFQDLANLAQAKMTWWSIKDSYVKSLEPRTLQVAVAGHVEGMTL